MLENMTTEEGDEGADVQENKKQMKRKNRRKQDRKKRPEAGK